MAKLGFKRNIGIKEYNFEDDENAVIRVNTRDANLIVRIEESKKVFKKLAAELRNSKEPVANQLEMIDKAVRNQLNYMFGSDVSSVVFANFSSVSIYDGDFAFNRFLDAILPEIEKDISEEQEKFMRNTEPYVKQAEQFD